MIRKLGPRLCKMHLKDAKAKGGEVNVLLCAGIARIPEVMHELHREKFSGLGAVEYKREDDVNRDMAQEITCARKLV